MLLFEPKNDLFLSQVPNPTAIPNVLMTSQHHPKIRLHSLMTAPKASPQTRPVGSNNLAFASAA
jgi:hypothetical protein